MHVYSVKDAIDIWLKMYHIQESESENFYSIKYIYNKKTNYSENIYIYKLIEHKHQGLETPIKAYAAGMGATS